MPSRPSDTISSARPFGARSSVALENPALSGFSDLGSFGMYLASRIIQGLYERSR